MRLMTGWMLMGGMLLSGVSGMVLCVGEDGHFAVEHRVHTPCACPQDSAQPDEKADLHTPVGCEDIPIDIGIASLDAKNLRTNRLFANGSANHILSRYINFTLDTAYRLQRSSSEAMLPISLSLLEKRTIVLLV